MENITTKCKCPRCSSTNVYVSKRGYSIWLGLLGAVIVFFVYSIWWIQASGYINETNEFVKSIMLAGIKNELLFFTALGLLAGFVGRGRVNAKCLNCGHTFSDLSSTEVHEAEKNNNSATESMNQEKAIAELKKAKELLDLNVMSQAEYDAKKEELMPWLIGNPDKMTVS